MNTEVSRIGVHSGAEQPAQFMGMAQQKAPAGYAGGRFDQMRPDEAEPKATELKQPVINAPEGAEAVHTGKKETILRAQRIPAGRKDENPPTGAEEEDAPGKNETRNRSGE